jgi:hypothetical protein
LWLRAVASRRELLSFGELPFVETKGALALHIRIGNVGATGSHGMVRKLGHLPSRPLLVNSNRCLKRRHLAQISIRAAAPPRVASLAHFTRAGPVVHPLRACSPRPARVRSGVL